MGWYHPDGKVYRLIVKGLKGGHSGVDIHLGRGNANKIMNRIIDYRDNVAPKSKAEYLVYHDQFPTDDYQFPRYVEYEQQFDAAFARAIRDQFDYLLATYFGDVEPDSVRVGGGAGAEAARQQYFAQVESRWLEIQQAGRAGGALPGRPVEDRGAEPRREPLQRP